MATGMREMLSFLYGEATGDSTTRKLQRLLARRQRRLRPPRSAPDPGSPSFTQADAILITYADQLTEAGVSPLRSLHSFLSSELGEGISGVHVLPFFPFSSDDGFSVIDYRRVDPRLGSWSDVRSMASEFRLMADLVLNHASARGRWFRGFLRGDRRFSQYFITGREGTDLAAVFRPRSHPLLTEFETREGRKLVWTTFGPDQVDLNYANPEVLLEMVDVLLFYVEQGAQLIRLDAVAFLWKEPGTSCVHLPQTHAVVRLLRAVVEEACPWVALVTETNVPHALNVSYLGSGGNEAHMVYNFPLPPLVVDAFHRGDAGVLSDWANGLKIPQEGRFLNFLSSHDGIGLLPARGYLSDSQITSLAELARARGGFVSMRTEAKGADIIQTPYELNITWLDALHDPAEDDEARLSKLTSSHCAMLCLAGVPAVYLNTLLGAPADRAEALRSGFPRAINRRKLDLGQMRASIADGRHFSAQALRALVRCLRVRRSQAAFHPAGAQEIIKSNNCVFTVLRTSPDRQSRVLCLHNFSARPQTLKFDAVIINAREGQQVRDLLTGAPLRVKPTGQGSVLDVSLGSYGAAWISTTSHGSSVS